MAIQEECKPLVQRIKAFDMLPFSVFDLLNEEGKIELLRQLGLPLSLLVDLNNLRKSQKGKKLFPEHGDYKIIFRESDCFYFQIDRSTSLPELQVEKVKELPKRFDKQRLFANVDRIEGQLHIRKWRTNDRMKPVGMTGSKLISDILNDAKIPSYQRENQFVVEDEGKILWCVGHCISREVLPEGAISIVSISVKH
jgi:tRNA(Ile)-lysidine synthetase-like protein